MAGDFLRCLFGHRWLAFHAEQCPVKYRICLRCGAIRHACNGRGK
jgi:hypothetical protein